MFLDYKDVGSKIVQKRRELSLTQKQLAEILNISNNHLSNIENGKAAPSFDLFVNICRELNASSDFLLFNYIHSNASETLNEKIKLCSDENKIIVSKLVDFLLEQQE